jgi:hypothetical protein
MNRRSHSGQPGPVDCYSDLHSRELQSRAATIKCSGSSDVEVSASQQLNLDISGGGDVNHLK